MRKTDEDNCTSEVIMRKVLLEAVEGIASCGQFQTTLRYPHSSVYCAVKFIKRSIRPNLVDE